MAPEDGAARIRLAAQADALGVARVHVASWRETYPGMVPDAMLATMTVERRTEVWKQILAAAETQSVSRVYVAEVDGEVVGFGACGSQRMQELKEKGYDSEVGALYVLKAFQRRKVGKGLMSAMAADLLGRGCSSVGLWVLRDNEAARTFYERCGGKVVAERDEERPDGVLVEVAYGWSDLNELARRTAD